MQAPKHYQLNKFDDDPIVNIKHPRSCTKQTRLVAISAGVTLHGQLIACDQALLVQATQDPVGRADLHPTFQSYFTQKKRLTGDEQRCHDRVLHGRFVQPNAKI